VLGYIYRGFPTVVAPEFGGSLTETGCESCGKCINVCPVGALVERNLYYKLNPLSKEITQQSCALCGTGCSIKVEAQTTKIVRITTPEDNDKDVVNEGFNGRNICFYGRFGWQSMISKERLTQPMQKTADGWKAITWIEAVNLIKSNIRGASRKRFEITPMVTMEEMLLFKKIAQNTGGFLTSNGYKSLFTDSLWPTHPTDKPYFQLEKYGTYVVVGEISHTLRTMIRLHQRQGKKLILVNPPEAGFNSFADEVLDNLDDLQVDMNMLFIYNINQLNEADAYDVWKKAALVSTCDCNVLMTSAFTNLSGMLALGIKASEEKADFIFSYGAYPELKNGETFKVAAMPFFEADAPVDLLIPQATYLEIDGVAIADAGIVTRYNNPAKSDLFNQLLKLTYELNWISPNLAETISWNQKAEEFLCSSEMLIKPKVLKPEIEQAGFIINAKLDDLAGLKKKKQTGFPKRV
jgi:ferredoxin